MFEKMFKRKIGKRKPCRYSWQYLCCFTLHVLDNVILDIAEGEVCCYSQLSWCNGKRRRRDARAKKPERA